VSKAPLPSPDGTRPTAKSVADFADADSESEGGRPLLRPLLNDMKERREKIEPKISL
jgi:hypothetical protein